MLRSTSCRVLTPYTHSPSSSTGQRSRDIGSSWTAATCQLPGPSWRCRPFANSYRCVAGQHLRPRHTLGCSDSALQYAWSECEILGSEQYECCSYCRSRGELDPWWEPHIIQYYLQPNGLNHMRRRSRPYIRLMCLTVWQSAAFYCSTIWLCFWGRRKIPMLIGCRLCRWPSLHQCTLRVELVWPSHNGYRCRVVSHTLYENY